MEGLWEKGERNEWDDEGKRKKGIWEKKERREMENRGVDRNEGEWQRGLEKWRNCKRMEKGTGERKKWKEE